MFSIPPSPERPLVARYAEADLPTEFGSFRVVVYRETAGGAPADPSAVVEPLVEHCALVAGDVGDGSDVLVRVHSECMTGEVFHSLKCDCREQLALALFRIQECGRGVVLYLRQEGRGIGLGNKIRAYALQQRGVDTVDANTMLGFDPDERRYGAAVQMLHDLGIRSIALMTNNPAKIDALRQAGVDVQRRIEHSVDPHELNRGYLQTKQERMGHLLEGGGASPFGILGLSELDAE
jgi:GTP cyclohydrolase II